MPGQIQVQTEVPPDCPPTLPHQRGGAPSSASRASRAGGAAGGFCMDIVARGLASVGCTLNIDVST